MNRIFFENGNILLRKGNKKDSESVALLIYSSGSDAFNFMHYNKINALKYIEYEFKTSFPSLFGRTYAWVGEDKQGKVISSAITYGTKENYLMTLGTIIKTILFYKFSSIKALKRLFVMGKITKPPKNKEWFLSCFGVLPSLRGKGLGEIILKQQMEWAKENGYTIYGLDVSENNPRAKILYQRMGFKEIEYKISITKKVPNLYKLEVKL